MIVLDTHAWLWWISSPEKLGLAARKALDQAASENGIYISAISSWEVALLMEKGAQVDYCDPHVPVFPRMRKHRFDKASVALSAEALRQYDLVLIATNHDAFDYNLVLKNARLIVDTRGVYREPAPNLVRA